MTGISKYPFSTTTMTDDNNDDMTGLDKLALVLSDNDNDADSIETLDDLTAALGGTSVHLEGDRR